VTRDMLEGASEVFVCNAVRGIIPVTRIDQRDYPAGPATQELREWLNESLDKE
jgi:4-amino-4-deoxychorismate lyase